MSAEVMETSKRIAPVWVQDGDRALAVVWPPVACACGRDASFVVNRGGITRCTDCDAKAASEASPCR